MRFAFHQPTSFICYSKCVALQLYVIVTLMLFNGRDRWTARPALLPAVDYMTGVPAPPYILTETSLFLYFSYYFIDFDQW
jgi:hypothetical protein